MKPRRLPSQALSRASRPRPGGMVLGAACAVALAAVPASGQVATTLNGPPVQVQPYVPEPGVPPIRPIGRRVVRWRQRWRRIEWWRQYRQQRFALDDARHELGRGGGCQCPGSRREPVGPRSDVRRGKWVPECSRLWHCRRGIPNDGIDLHSHDQYRRRPKPWFG